MNYISKRKLLSDFTCSEDQFKSMLDSGIIEPKIIGGIQMFEIKKSFPPDVKIRK